ncbi:Autophagy-related protein 13 [Pseudozyma hubeiensis]|nr:Autophagy-related protein 13 [Pseudozyma hubeiensis]
MPTSRDIKAKNAQFAATARENAGKPRIRTPKKVEGEEVDGESKQEKQKRGRTNVRPARQDRAAQNKVVGAGLSNNKLALGLIVFVVCGGVFFEMMRLFF